MYYEIAFLVFMAIVSIYFFYLGEVTSKELASSKNEHPIYTGELATKTVMSYGTSFLCAVSAIICILRVLN